MVSIFQLWHGIQFLSFHFQHWDAAFLFAFVTVLFLLLGLLLAQLLLWP